MILASDMTRYFVWACVIMAGALCAIADWRWIKRPVFGLVLVAGMIGGIVVTKVSPFDFATGGYFMEGVLISGGSALALVGYVFATIAQFACRRIGGCGSS
jgi:hypothetical protein